MAEGSTAIGKNMRELDEVADEAEVAVLGLVRRGQRLPGLARRTVDPEGRRAGGRGEPGRDRQDGRRARPRICRPEARAQRAGRRGSGPAGGRGATGCPDRGPLGAIAAPALPPRRQPARRVAPGHAVSRARAPARDPGRRHPAAAGPAERLPEVATWLGCLPLAERGLPGRAARTRRASPSACSPRRSRWRASACSICPWRWPASRRSMCCSTSCRCASSTNSVEWPVIVLLGSPDPDRRGAGDQRRHRADRRRPGGGLGGRFARWSCWPC